MTSLAVSSFDPVLHVLAPVSLAAVHELALIIDLDSASGWPFPVGSLEDLVRGGPTADDLKPSRRGLAILGGPVSDPQQVEAVLDTLIAAWPAVVVRRGTAEPVDVAIAPALPWLPAGAVTVATGLSAGQGSIPRPPRWLVRKVVGGSIDGRWRWFRHWHRVWAEFA